MTDLEQIETLTREVEIIKGKFKGIKGYIFVDELFLNVGKITVFDKQGNEYWVDDRHIKRIGE